MIAFLRVTGWMAAPTIKLQLPTGQTDCRATCRANLQYEPGSREKGAGFGWVCREARMIV